MIKEVKFLIVKAMMELAKSEAMQVAECDDRGHEAIEHLSEALNTCHVLERKEVTE